MCDVLQRGMNEVFTGGLGSYATFLMVLSFVQVRTHFTVHRLHSCVRSYIRDPSRRAAILACCCWSSLSSTAATSTTRTSASASGTAARTIARQAHSVANMRITPADGQGIQGRFQAHAAVDREPEHARCGRDMLRGYNPRSGRRDAQLVCDAAGRGGAAPSPITHCRFEYAYHVLSAAFTMRSGPRDAAPSSAHSTLLSHVLSVDDDVADFRSATIDDDKYRRAVLIGCCRCCCVVSWPAGCGCSTTGGPAWTRRCRPAIRGICMQNATRVTMFKDEHRAGRPERAPQPQHLGVGRALKVVESAIATVRLQQ